MCQLLITGTMGSAAEGALAVDDLAIEMGECSPLVSCTFESGLCGWLEDDSTNTFWQLKLASQGDNGVLIDHSLSTGEGGTCRIAQ